LILYDNHNRPLNYLRLAVTDRCNLRCFYCMPQERIQYLPKKEILTFEEMERLVTLMANLGITKVRLTGGEPFVRNDLMKLIRTIADVPGIKDLHLTTNGILTAPHIPELKKIGIKSVNLSLDSLDKKRFFEITRRDEFDKTWETLQLFLEHEIPLKINVVVMEGKNIDDIIPLVELTRNTPIDVRFIEEMPFNGKGNEVTPLTWNHKKIIGHITEHYPDLKRMQDPAFSTSYNYMVSGFKGTVGVIAAFSRTFCGTCNRIRVTARGELKTCLYGEPVLDIKALFRNGSSNQQITQKLLDAFSNRAKDGFEAEKQSHSSVFASMSTIGG
jgi:molybdenum cofactor biosynthesis protein A